MSYLVLESGGLLANDSMELRYCLVEVDNPLLIITNNKQNEFE